MNLKGERAASYDFSSLPLASRWILSRLQDVAGRVHAHLEEFRFDQAAHELYHFVWDELCDWYIEASKTYFADPDVAPRARAVLLEALEATLRLLHPIIPYVTEELWQRLRALESDTSSTPPAPRSIMVATFPRPDPGKSDPDAVEQMERLMAIVSAVRTIRATYAVEPRRRIDVTVVAAAAADRAFVEAHAPQIRSLARVERLEVLAAAPEGPRTIQQSVGSLELRIPLAGLFDIAAEKARLERDRAKVESELQSLRGRLANPQFVERAKPELVVQSRERVAELEARRAKVQETLEELSSDGG
jgi:valyl-tRNA synthetase